MKRIAAAVGIALMGMGGVALAAPKADPGPPEQAQGNGPPPQAHDPAPAPEVKAKTRTPQGTGGPVRVPHDLPPQARGHDNPGSGVGQSGQSGQSGGSGGAGDHAGPTSGAARGHGRTPSTAGRISGCRAARCRGGASEAGSGGGGGGGEQSKVTGGRQGTAEGGVLGESEARPDNQAGAAPGEQQVGGALESGSALGLDQGGGEESDATRGSFNRALPFTGFELALLAGIGALLGLAGLRLRRSAA